MFVSCLACLLMMGPLGIAAAPDLKKGVTDPSHADADFAIQGEYSGTACAWGCRQQMGLQVVALGEGRFDALVYPGGLPGNGYNGGVKSKLSGQREGGRVSLQGEHMRATLQTGLAVVLTDNTGQLLGYLHPMHRYSRTAGAVPPPGAVVLFDGRPSERLKNATISENGLLQVGAETVDAYRDFYLHAEFKTPYMPYARGQARGNSGFYLQQRYEVQVLDSFGLESQNNDAGGLYKFKAPDLNMCFPPLSWQTYDIDFRAARFDDSGKKIEPARITVWHNGVVIHNHVALENKTGGGKPEGPQALPILFQNHGNPVEFRNVWLIDRSAACATTPACCGR